MIGTVLTVLKAPPDEGWNWTLAVWGPVAVCAGRTHPHTSRLLPRSVEVTGRNRGRRYASYAGFVLPPKNSRPLANPPYSGALVGLGSVSGYCIVVAILGLRHERYS